MSLLPYAVAAFGRSLLPFSGSESIGTNIETGSVRQGRSIRTARLKGRPQFAALNVRLLSIVRPCIPSACGHSSPRPSDPRVLACARIHYSITSSADACKPNGTVRFNCLAVLRLITNSNFTGWRTGRSSGLAPLRMRPTSTPACRNESEKLAA